MDTTAKSVSIRAALFVGLTALSLPLAFPVGVFVFYPLLSWLLPTPLPDTPFWAQVKNLVFDLPAYWPYIVLAPGLRVSIDGPYVISYATPVVFWTIIGIAYGWLTRRVRKLYVALGVLPTVWVVGFGTYLYAYASYS